MPKKKKGYDWSNLQTAPQIEEHSRAKHRVLQDYLKKYISVLTANPRKTNLKLFVIDGFSGGGVYTDEITQEVVDGSPLVLIKTIKDEEARINSERIKFFTIDANYYFVEKDKHAARRLKLTLDPWLDKFKLKKKVEIIKGTYIDALPGIIKSIKSTGRIRKHRCIFLLDQYGYSDVSFESLRFIFQIFPDGAEVILTYATDALISYLSHAEGFKKAIKTAGLEDIITDSVIDNFRERKPIETKQARLAIEQLLATNILQKSGAKYFTPFFITSDKSRRSYLLVHLSNHVKARDEMNKVHWGLQNHFKHYGTAGFDNFKSILGFDPKYENLDQLLMDFSFDDDAESRTYEALREDVPGILSFRDGVTFGEILSQTCNHTPANSDHYKKILYELVLEKYITITSPDGKVRRSVNAIELTDRIIKNSQLIFSF